MTETVEQTTGCPADDLLSGLTASLDQLVAAVEAGELRRLNRAEELVAGSTAHVLTRVSRVEAHRRVHAAEALGRRRSMQGDRRPARHERFADTARTGQVPVENTRVAVGCLRRMERRFFATEEQLGFAETHVVEAALVFGPEELRRVAQHLEGVLFPDGCLADDQQVADARQVTLTPKADGSWMLEGRLTGLCGAALSAVITSLAAPVPAPDGTPDGSPGERSAGQRRHDAMHATATMLLRTGGLPRSGGIPASIIVTIAADDLLTNLASGSGHGTTADGGTLTVAEIMRLPTRRSCSPPCSPAGSPGVGWS